MRPRVIHTGQALVDLIVEVPDLPTRGQNVMATSAAEYAGGAVTVLLAAARFGAQCVHAGALGTGPYGDLIRAALAADGIAASAPAVTTDDTGVCVVMVEPSAERTFVTTLGAERDITVESLSTADVQPGDLVCVTGYSLAVAQTRDPLLAWLETLPDTAVVVLDPGAGFAALPVDVRDRMLVRTDVCVSRQPRSPSEWSCSRRGEPDDAVNRTGTAVPGAVRHSRRNFSRFDRRDAGEIAT